MTFGLQYKNEWKETSQKSEDQKKCSEEGVDEVRALELGGNERKPVCLQFREEGDWSQVSLEKS